MIFENQAPLSECSTIQAATPTGGIAGGSFATDNAVSSFALFGVALRDGDFEFSQYTRIVYSPKVKAKKAAGALQVGEAIYFNPTNGNVSTTSTTGNFKCGWVKEAAASGDTHVFIEFDGRNI